MRRPRTIALVVLAVAAASVALVVRSADAPYRVVAVAVDAGQLVPGNDVRIGAAKVGTVSRIRLTPGGLAELTLDIDEDATPLRRGTTATVRAFSVAAAASRFVSLGPPPGVTGTLPDGGRIRLVDTTSPVDFDALLTTFDEPTRRGIRALISGFSEVNAGRTADARATLGRAGPALQSTATTMEELARDRPAFRALVRQGAEAATAIAGRSTQLTDLVGRTGQTLEAFSSEQGAIRRSLAALPPTLRQANATWVELRAALDDLDGTVALAKPATRRLQPLLAQVNYALQRARGVTPGLAAAVSSPGADDDLTDLLRDLPPLSRSSAGAFPRAVDAMDRSQENLDRLRAYTPDIFGAVSNLGQASSYYDANGHYVRVLPVLSALGFDPGTNTLGPKANTERLRGFSSVQRRCPGAATAALADGSAPVRAPGCDPSATPPGP